MYYLNQEILKNRYEQFTQFDLLEPLAPVYEQLKLSLESQDRNTFFTEKVQQPDCIQVNPIYGFPNQATELFQSYGYPTALNFHMYRQKRYLIIGTQQSIIICIEIVHGRVETICAVLNSGEKQNRYGAVSSMQCWERYLLVGFSRGDVQLFEVGRKWEKLNHESQLHNGKVVSVVFLPSNSVEALSLDEQVSVMERLMAKASLDKLYKNGKIYHIKKKSSTTLIKQNSNNDNSSWWKSAKSLFKSDNKEPSEHTTDPSIKQSSSDTEILGKFALDLKLMPETMAQALNQDISHFVIAALLYSNRVEIIKFYKGSLKCEIIYTLKRNNFSLDSPNEQWESGELSWGEGYFQKSYQNAKLLCIRWGDIFHLVKCINIEEDLEIVEGAVYRFEKEKGQITKSSFLTNNIIYVFSNNDWIALIHTTQFQFAKQDDNIVVLEAKTRMLSKEEIEPQQPEICITYEGPKNQCAVQIYENGVISLRNKQVLIERLQSWNEYLDDLIEKNQWEKAMHQGMLIYQGQIKILSQIASSLQARQEQMSAMLQKIAFTHVMFVIKPIDIPISQTEKENKIKKTIEFLLRVDNMNYALTVLKDFFKDIDQMKLYFICLEPFIKEKQIAVIPESFFNDYVKFYEGNKEMISQLILQLDLHQQEPTLLIKVCMDCHLYKAMIYLCTKQGDFLTGLMKLMDLWETKYTQEQQQQTRIQKDKIRNFRIKLGYNILAYVKMCVKGVNLLGERIPHNIYYDMLRSLVTYIFNQENLKLFILIDIRMSLQLILLFLSNKIFNNIKQITLPNYSYNIISNVSEVVIKMFGAIEQTRNLLNEKEYYQLLHNPKNDVYYQLTKQQQQHHYIFFYSQLLIQYPHNINQQFKQQIYYEILQESYFQTISNYNFDSNNHDQIYLDSYNVNKNAYLIYLYDICNINQSSEITQLSQLYPELNAYLTFQLQKYQDCILIYLNMDNQMMKKSVFEVIENLLNREFNKFQFQEFIIENCDSLMNISQTQTNRIFKEYFHDLKLQLKIIQKLEKSPQNQLLYLKQYVKNEKSSDEIRLLYLNLLCQRSPKEVLIEVQTGHFPIDDAITICEKFKVYNAAAYLLQKNGAIQKALDMLSVLFFGRLKECHKSFARSKNISDSDFEEIFEKLNYIIDLCSQIEDDGYWFQFLDSFFKYFKLEQLTDLKVPELLRKLHGDIVSDVLCSMSKCIELEKLLISMQQHYGSIPLRVFLKTNRSIQEKFAFELPTYNIAMQSTDITYKELNKTLLRKMQAGVTVERYCCECNDKIIKCTKAVAFTCGHSYHQECYIELYGNNQKSFNSLKMKNQKIMQNCFACLEFPSQYIEHLIVQASLKKQQFDFDKYVHKQAQVVAEAKQTIIRYDKVEKKEKAIKKLKFDDFNKLYSSENVMSWQNW